MTRSSSLLAPNGMDGRSGATTLTHFYAGRRRLMAEVIGMPEPGRYYKCTNDDGQEFYYPSWYISFGALDQEEGSDPIGYGFDRETCVMNPYTNSTVFEPGKPCPHPSQVLFTVVGQFQLDPDDGLLKYTGQIGGSDVERLLTVVPSGWQKHLVYAYHDGPMGGMHRSREAVLASLRTTCWWSNMARDVARHIQRCLGCRQRKTLHTIAGQGHLRLC